MLIRVAVTLRTNGNISFQCAFHVVWCPKYGRRVLGGRIEARLKELIGGVIEEKGAWLKGRSSRVLRQEFPSLTSRLPTLWTNSCFVATVGGAPMDVVRRYVVNQKDR